MKRRKSQATENRFYAGNLECFFKFSKSQMQKKTCRLNLINITLTSVDK